MNVFINLKSVGKRRPALQKTPYTLPDGISSPRRLIEAVVRLETDKYNKRGVDNMLISFLTETEIAERGETGKIGFGRLYSDKKADPGKAVEAALLGYSDGLFRMTVDNEEAGDLDSPLVIREGATITFIRLTFLAGRLW